MSNDNKVRVVYMGRRINSANKLSYLYSYADDLNDQFTLKGKLGDYPIGCIIEAHEVKNAFRAPYVGVGKINDDSLMYSWGVEDNLNYCQVKSQQHWKKLDKSESNYDQLISDINDLIKTLPTIQRKAFVFKLISDLKFDP